MSTNLHWTTCDSWCARYTGWSWKRSPAASNLPDFFSCTGIAFCLKLGWHWSSHRKYKSIACLIRLSGDRNFRRTRHDRWFKDQFRFVFRWKRLCKSMPREFQYIPESRSTDASSRNAYSPPFNKSSKGRPRDWTQWVHAKMNSQLDAFVDLSKWQPNVAKWMFYLQKPVPTQPKKGQILPNFWQAFGQIWRTIQQRELPRERALSRTQCRKALVVSSCPI